MATAPISSESLLRARPQPSGTRAGRRWAYSLPAMVFASAFILYHLSVLMVWNTPKIELFKPFQNGFLDGVAGKQYFHGTANHQSWQMFAPNPTQTNAFVQVLVVDQRGDLWDFEQDIWAEDRYPYLWYDRRGKINRRIDGKKGYQRIYGAWVCREWERRNAGEAAVEVRFVRLRTSVPQPSEVLERGHWDAWAVEPERTEQETIKCKSAQNGQLPEELLLRYGLEPLPDEGRFKPVPKKTWVDEAED